MKAWKLIGYAFSGLGTILVLIAFLIGITEAINPATFFLGESSETAIFSSFLSTITPWIILASVLFVIGGIGLYVGREKNSSGTTADKAIVNERLDSFEEIVNLKFELISKRLDKIEEQQKKSDQN